MLSLRRSPAKAFNKVFKPVTRKGGNGGYVEAQAAKDGNKTSLLLLGGKGPVDFRLRIAQAHARDDLLPSAWSHVAILGEPTKNPLRRSVFEIPMSGRASIGYPPATNGVVVSSVGEYDDPDVFPNVAVLQVPVSFSIVAEGIEAFRKYRNVLDALELLLAWWGFAWGVGTTGNPLFGGLGIPSAAFVEYVIAGAGYDLVPGFPSRSSCPEAIWQSTRWWHEFPRAAPPDAAEAVELAPISGAYDAPHYLLDPIAEATPRRRRAAR
jgi:hypothetical protein